MQMPIPINQQQKPQDRLAKLVESVTKMRKLMNDISDGLFRSVAANSGHNAECFQDQFLQKAILLQNELVALEGYYENQKRAMAVALSTFSSEITRAAVSKVPGVEAPVDMYQPTMTPEQVRQKVMDQLTAGGLGHQINHDSPVIDKTRAATDALIKHAEKVQQGSQVPESTTVAGTSGTSYTAMPHLLPHAVAVPPETEKPKPLEVPVMQNLGLAQLLGSQSPLLDIFAPSPMVPQGRGKITVGSPGFKWYVNTNATVVSDSDRATLPTGFYGGSDHPQTVIIRLKSIILLWSFDMSVESMLIYAPDIAFAQGNQRWFKPSEVTTTYINRLVTELKQAFLTPAS